ncbi:polysaccharide pyruvyl transferase family protein [Bacteroides sp. OttesenSCG-928-D19]|nr:polysaccharide pyruvyl transferase family protein [Bacteroides sp. OttesenSCG-928-D19]
MKIGILTYHRAENYGALLQAYALKTHLEKTMENVSFVDYWPIYHFEHYKIFSKKKFCSLNLRGRIAYFVHFILWGTRKYIRKYKLSKFMKTYLSISGNIKYVTEQDICKEFDIVIYGSDQIWRKQNIHDCKNYNPWYFGSNNIQAHRKIVYAGSMGVIEVEDADKSFLIGHMNNFAAISVREEDLQILLNKLDFHPQLVIDPVFLLSKEDWEKLVMRQPKLPNTKYILFYNLLNTSESEQLANSLQEKLKLPVKEINMKLAFNCLNKKKISTASVEEFIQLIYNAEFVITNSFHGVAFSIIFKKQFYAVGMREKSSRAQSLLNLAGLDDRYIENGEIEKFCDINYKVVDERICEFVRCSKDFLKKALS